MVTGLEGGKIYHRIIMGSAAEDKTIVEGPAFNY